MLARVLLCCLLCTGCGGDARTTAAPDAAVEADGTGTPGKKKKPRGDDDPLGVDPRERGPDGGGDGPLRDGGCDDCTDGVDAGPPKLTSFRMTSMRLVDPPIVVVIDVTALVNDTLLGPALESDVDPVDGMLDLSFVTALRPLDPLRETGGLDMLFADCPPPATDTVCRPNAERGVNASRYTNRTTGTCLEPREGTLAAGAAGPNVPAAPCFVSDPEPFALEFAGVLLELTDARVAASYVGSAADAELVDGSIQGFLSKATADSTMVPADRPLVGGLIVGNTFRDEDLDEGPGGEPGYWVYLNFEADQVDYRP